MDTIDVHDLPEPLAKAVAETVRNLREQLCRKESQGEVEFPVWPLGVTGKVAREEIYDHLDDAV